MSRPRFSGKLCAVSALTMHVDFHQCVVVALPGSGFNGCEFRECDIVTADGGPLMRFPDGTFSLQCPTATRDTLMAEWDEYLLAGWQPDPNFKGWRAAP